MLDLTPVTNAVAILQQHERDAKARVEAIQVQVGTLNSQVATLTQQVTDLQNQQGQEPDTAPLLATIADIQATTDAIGQEVAPTPPATGTDDTQVNGA